MISLSFPRYGQNYIYAKKRGDVYYHPKDLRSFFLYILTCEHCICLPTGVLLR